MIEARHQTCFVFELLAQILAGAQRLFHGDLVTEAQVDSFIDHAHAAAAELAHDPIAILQNLADRQHMIAERFALRMRLGHSDLD